MFTLWGGAVSCGSKKQTSMVTSTAEGEYIDCSTTIQEALWLKYFLSDLELIGEKSLSQLT